MAQGGNIRNHRSMTFQELQNITKDGGISRVGATDDPKRRAQEYAREGYSGTMYKFKTENMRKAEDKLLSVSPGWHNVQRSSNAPDQSGYVYAIKERK